MKKLGAFLLWTLVIAAIVLATDQLVIRIEPQTPVLAEVRTFYVDFRARLLQLGHRLPAQLAELGEKASARPKAVPDKPKAEEPAPPPPKQKSAALRPGPAPPAETSSPRYLYVDKQGELHMADSLEEIPPAFRKDAQRLEK